MTCALDDAVVLRQPGGLKTFERSFHIQLFLEGVRQRRRIIRGLGDAGGNVRPRDKSRIAQDRDPAKRHAW